MMHPTYTILLCDDDRLILATLSSALQSAGYQVIEADNGDDAILLARQHRPDLAMLDMRMNGKSGLDVAAYLRDYVGTPFLFLSAFGDERTMTQARAFGALEFLVKPIDTHRVVTVVGQVLDTLAGVRPQMAGGELPLARSPAAPPTQWSRELTLAVGILMARQGLTEEAAMLRLMTLSRASGQPLDVVAADVVERLQRVNATKTDGVPGG